MERKHLCLLTILFTVALVLFSCRKDIEYYLLDRDRPTSEILENAKIWYLQSLDSEKKGPRLRPHWKNAWQVSRENEPLMLVVPANEKRLQNKDISIRRFFIFTVRGDEVNRGNIVEFMGEQYDVTKNLDFLLQSMGKDEITGFDGSFINYDINYNYVNSTVVKNGKKINATTNIKSLEKDGVLMELNRNTRFGIQMRNQSSISTMSFGDEECVEVYPTWTGPPLSSIGEDCMVSVTVTTVYDASTGCVISQNYVYNGHVCPGGETGDASSWNSGSGSESGDGGDEPPYGGGGAGNSKQDREPASYHWRDLLEDLANWHLHLSEPEPWFITVNGNNVPNPEVYNCHYYTFGPDYALDTFADEGYPKWVFSVNLLPSDWTEVNGYVQVGDVVIYKGIPPGAPEGTTPGLLHSGIVTAVDAQGYATEVSSKMGNYQIIQHHPRDVPAAFGPTSATFIYNGEYHKSRTYYRKKP